MHRHRHASLRHCAFVSSIGLTLLVAACDPPTDDPLVTNPTRSADAAVASSTRPGAGSVPAPRRPLPDLHELPVFPDLELGVDAAYAAIPHRRTEFDFDQTTLPADDAAYLQRVFFLIDQGVRARVVGYRDLYHHGSSDSAPDRRMDALIGAFHAMDPPAALTAYHQAMIDALTSQRTVFENWTDQGDAFPHRRSIGADRDVRAASRHLRGAYQILMRTYRDEPKANKDAFFDYHCALDFI